MNRNIFKISPVSIYVILMGVVVVTRCFSSRLFPNPMLESIILIIITALPFLINKFNFTVEDVLWLVPICILLFNRSSSYQLVYVIIFICGVLSRIYLKKNIYKVEVLFKIIVVFSLITCFATWLSILAKPIYIDLVVPFLNESGRAEVLRTLELGNLSGLTDHYSRNAYYIAAGIMTLISSILSNSSKNNKLKIGIVVFELVTLLTVGKRGHTIFLLLSLYLCYMAIQKTYSKKVINSLKLLMVVLVGGVLIFTFVPASRYILERFISEFDSGDFTNGRASLYLIAVNAFKTNPIFGIGYGGFRAITSNVYAGVHNDYLQFLCETGIVGFLAFIGLGIYSYIQIIIVLRKIVSQKVLVDCQIKKYAIWAFLVQTFVLLYSFTGLPHFDFEVNTIYLFACGITSVIAFTIKQENVLHNEKSRNSYIV